MTDHLLHFKMDELFHLTVDKVTCPHENQGVARPCAVWADESGDTKENECSLASWVEAAGGWAEEIGFRFPQGTYWIDALNPLPVKFHFVHEYIEVWPTHLEAP